MKTASDHHYYAATARGWAVGRTRAEALRKCALDYDADHLRRLAESNGFGARCITVRVDLPITADYRIEDYVPVDVPTGDREVYALAGRRKFVRIEND